MPDQIKNSNSPFIDFNKNDQLLEPVVPLQPVNNPNQNLVDFLNNEDEINTFAVAANQDNNIATKGFGKDLLEMNYGQLAAKYGKEVADNSYKIQDGLIKYENDHTANREINEVITDTALGAVSGLVDVAGSTASLITAGADQSGFFKKELNLPGVATGISKITDDATGFINSFQTEELRNKNKLTSIQSALDQADRDEFYKNFRGNKDDPVANVVDSFREFGDEFLDGSKRLYDNPSSLLDTISQSAGSLAPSSLLAKTLSKTAIKATSNVTKSITANKVSEIFATAVAVGISEGSGVYEQTLSAVLALDHDDLLNTSDKYRELLGQNLTPEEAKNRLATDTASEAFSRQLPVAIGIGLVSSKFERSPIEVFDGKTIPSIASEIATQSVEEGLQGGTGQLSQNLATQNQVDSNTRLIKGVGENTAAGTLAGIGLTTGLATPAIAGNTVGLALEGAASTIESTRDIISSATNSKIAGKIANSDLNINVPNINTDTVTKVVKDVSEGVKNVSKKSIDIATPIVKDTVKKSTDTIVKLDKELTKPIVKNGKIAFDTFKPIANSIKDGAVAASKVTSKAGLKLNKSVGENSFKLGKTFGNEFIIPAVKGTFKSSRVILPVVIQSAKITSKISTPISKQLGKVPVSIAMEFSSPILRSLKTISEKPSRKEFESSSIKLNNTFNDIRETYKQSNIEDLPDYMTDLVLTQDSVKIPDEFKDVASTEQSLLLNIVGVLTKISSKESNYKEMSPHAILYASTKLNELNHISNAHTELYDQFSEVLSNPEVKKLIKLSKELDLNNIINSDIKINDKDTSASLIVAKNNPLNVNPNYINKLLNHRDSKNLSEQDIRLLKSASKIAKAVNNHVDQQVEISKEYVVQLSKKVAYINNPKKLPKKLNLDDVSRSIQIDGFKDRQGNDLRSISDFASDIFIGSQSENGTIKNKDDIDIDVQTVSDQFEKFVTHLSNKVDALNKSFDLKKNGENNINVGFDSLVGGIKIVKAGSPGSAKPVYYNYDSPKSIELASKVYNDAKVAAEVYNTILETFPNLSGSKKEISKLNRINEKEENTTVIEETNTSLSAFASREVLVDEKLEIIERKKEEKINNDLFKNTHKSFSDTFNIKKKDTVFLGIEDAINKIKELDGTQDLIEIYENLKDIVGISVQKSVSTITMSDKDLTPINEAVGKNPSLLNNPRFVSLSMLDQETGTYNQEVLDAVLLSTAEWMTTARNVSYKSLKDTLNEDLNIEFDNITSTKQLETIQNSLDKDTIINEISKQTLEILNIEKNTNSTIVQFNGMLESLVDTVLNNMAVKKDFIEYGNVPIKLDNGKIVNRKVVLITDVLKETQSKTNINSKGVIKRLTGQKDKLYPSIGKKITNTKNTQKRTNFDLSKKQLDAVKNIQDTPYLKAIGAVNLFRAIDKQTLMESFGWRSIGNLEPSHPLALSILGKNNSIERDYKEALEIVELIEDTGSDETAAYFSVEITKGGRHQQVGINPQSNKILRMLVTPTHSILDLNNQKHIDSLWIVIAQASGIYKVEKLQRDYILKNIESEFNSKFGEAVNEVQRWLNEGGNLNSKLIPKELDTQQLSAIQTVAEFRNAKLNGDNTYNSTISFELDGITNGTANMMVNHGQYLISLSQFENFSRVGFFPGNSSKTINDYYSDSNNKDLYEHTSFLSQSNLFKEAKNDPKLNALIRLMTVFGDFKINQETGDIELTRNTSKQPTTKIVYKSGNKGVGKSIAGDFITELYRGILGSEQLQYPGLPGYSMKEDLELVLDYQFPNKINKNNFRFPSNIVDVFNNYMSETVGDVLTNAANSVIGKDIQQVNDIIVLYTQIQSEYVRALFEIKLNEVIEDKKSRGVIKSKNELTQKDYNNILNEIRDLGVVFSNQDQDLAIGGVTNSLSPNGKDNTKFKLYSDISGKTNQETKMIRPTEVGVGAIAALTIGRGDGTMINNIASSPNSPKNSIFIFDGIDFSVLDYDKYSTTVNEGVFDSWKDNPLQDVYDAMSEFIENADPELVKNSFNKIRYNNFNKKNVTYSDNNLKSFKDIDNLLKDYSLKSQARKNVFKTIPLSVHQMGGSLNAFNQEGVNNEKEITYSEINHRINDEYLKLTNQIEIVNETKFSAENVKQYDTSSIFKSIKKYVKNKELLSVTNSVESVIDKSTKIVIGKSGDLNKYRQENYLDDGQIISDRGTIDIENNTIFVEGDKIDSSNVETIIHELIHATTFKKVLNHYEGNTNEAVNRLEKLMEEFLTLEGNQEINNAKSSILEYAAKNDNFSKAAALNEFMAWSLSNQNIIDKIKSTQSNLFKSLSKKVIQLMKRVIGSVNSDIFSNVLFNTKLLNDSYIDPQDSNNQNDNSENEVTPAVHKNSNFWIDNVKNKIGLSKISLNRTAHLTLKDYKDVSSDILKQLDFGGFTLSEYQKQTFQAIHIALATEMRLDAKSSIAMGTIFDYVVDNLKPEMLGSIDGELKYSTVMDLLGNTKNEEGVSDSIAILLALSQTSKSFRKALDKLPEPENNKENEGSLNEYLTNFTSFLMQKLVGSVDLSKGDIKDVIDNLAQGLIIQDSDRDYSLLRGLTSSLNKADKHTSGALSKLAERTDNINTQIQDSTKSEITKTIANSVTLVTSFLDDNRSKIASTIIKDSTHMGTSLDNFKFAQEFVSEIVGTDKTNSEVVALLDKTNFGVSSVRQAYREDLPVILQNKFDKHPDESEWKTLHKVLGKGDFSFLFSNRNPDQSMRLISDPVLLDKKIFKLEDKIKNKFSKKVSKNILNKSQQLADFMNDKGAGYQLITNAYAINKLSGQYIENMTSDIDSLISMYALKNTSKEEKQIITDLYESDPEAISNLLVYMKGLNKEEDSKIVSENAKLNGYKGFIPNEGSKGARLIIDSDSNQQDLEKRGYVRIGDYTGQDQFSTGKRGYYFTTVKQSGNYSQGVLQSVQDTYRGVDATTGLTVTGKTSGIISEESANVINDKMSKTTSIPDNKEALIPRYDDDGNIIHYERAINPDLLESKIEPRSNLALMLGSWAGRQVEEKFAQNYNNELITKLKDIYDKRESGTDSLFINLSDRNLKDKIYKDSWDVISPQTKQYIQNIFGEEGFYIRKDMINLAVGYRDPSILDAWTGKTRLPDSVQKTIRTVSTMIMGNKAMTYLSKGEEGLQSIVSSSKDLIVVRSLIVPYMNAQANIMQLMTRGVGSRDVIKGTRDKLIEIEKYNENVIKIIELDAEIALSSGDKNRVSILKNKIETIKGQNTRMSINPLIQAGAYKNISEGITDLDVELTDGKLGEWVEVQINKLPAGLKTTAKYGLMSKDTNLYKAANKSVQYGDFIAKSILYDHYVNRQNVDSKEALERINEEFVNFSVLPGRTRSYLESMGATWFLTFKIRIMKTAMKMMRDNPVRSLIVANTVADLGSPIGDNLATVIAEDKLDYSIGWDMLFGAPELNPWVQMSDWDFK